MSDASFALAQLAQAVAGLVRYGTVVEVGPDAERASVSFVPGQRTALLKVFQPAAGPGREHDPIFVGEQVMVLAPNGDSNCGAILRGLSGGDNPPASTSPTMHVRRYPDGATVAYDWARKILLVDALAADGTLVLQAKNIVIRTGEGGYYHVDHAGYATRLTHQGGSAFESESWTAGAVVVGKPDNGFSPPQVPSPGEGV